MHFLPQHKICRDCLLVIENENFLKIKNYYCFYCQELSLIKLFIEVNNH